MCERNVRINIRRGVKELQLKKCQSLKMVSINTETPRSRNWYVSEEAHCSSRQLVYNTTKIKKKKKKSLNVQSCKTINILHLFPNIIALLPWYSRTDYFRWMTFFNRAQCLPMVTPYTNVIFWPWRLLISLNSPYKEQLNFYKFVRPLWLLNPLVVVSEYIAVVSWTGGKCGEIQRSYFYHLRRSELCDVFYSLLSAVHTTCYTSFMPLQKVMPQVWLIIQPLHSPVIWFTTKCSQKSPDEWRVRSQIVSGCSLQPRSTASYP